MTRAQDNAARIGLLILSIGLAIAAFGVGAAISEWNDIGRTLLLGVIGGAAAGAFWGGVEIRTTYIARTPLRLKRRGERSETAALPPPVGTAPVHPVRIALHPKNSLVAGLIFLVAAIGAWMIASRMDFSNEGAIVTIVALAMAPWLTYFTIRSALRIMLARCAIKITGEALLLGSALGYWPPLQLPRESVVAIALPETGGEDISIALADRNYRIDPRQMIDPTTVAHRMQMAWPERTAAADPDQFVVPDFEITNQQPMQAPAAVVDLANRTMRTRRVLATTVLVASVALVGLSAAWYLSRRIANDRLLTDGRPVVARITDVDGSSRGPDTMTVSFVADGEPVTAEIQSGWFKGFRRSAVGGSGRIYVDRRNPAFVRLPQSRNINQATWLALMIAVLAAILSLAYFRQQQAYKTLLDGGRWGRRPVRFEKPGGHWMVQVRAESESTGQELWVEAGRVRAIATAGERDTWSCENEATALLVLDETTRVVAVSRFRHAFSSRTTTRAITPIIEGS